MSAVTAVTAVTEVTEATPGTPAGEPEDDILGPAGILDLLLQFLGTLLRGATWRIGNPEEFYETIKTGVREAWSLKRVPEHPDILVRALIILTLFEKNGICRAMKRLIEATITQAVLLKGENPGPLFLELTSTQRADLLNLFTNLSGMAASEIRGH